MSSLNPYKKTTASRRLRSQYLDDSGKVNPKTGIKGERRFDKKGTVNAWNKKDALVAIADVLNDKNVQKVKRAAYRKEAELAPDVRRDVLLNALTDPTGQGLARLGQELLVPIRDVIDYEGWARKILRVRNLQQGEVHRIARDTLVVAFIVGQDGQSLFSQAVGRYVFPPEFKITAFPEVDIQDIYQMNFDVIERQQDLAKQMIMLREDTALVMALGASATAMNDIIYFSTFNIGTFEDIKYQVERHRLIVDKFLINRQEVSSLIKNMHNFVDPVTERELILMGYVGTVLNSQIVTTAGTGTQEVISPGTVYAVTEGGFLGEMGIRLDLMSEPYTKYNQQETKKGWMFMELIGQSIVNSRAVAKGQQV